MTTTPLGIICDVCHKPILSPENKTFTFRVKGVDRDLHCDSKCRKIIEDMYKDKKEELSIIKKD